MVAGQRAGHVEPPLHPPQSIEKYQARRRETRNRNYSKSGLASPCFLVPFSFFQRMRTTPRAARPTKRVEWRRLKHSTCEALQERTVLQACRFGERDEMYFSYLRRKSERKTSEKKLLDPDCAYQKLGGLKWDPQRRARTRQERQFARNRYTRAFPKQLRVPFRNRRSETFKERLARKTRGDLRIATLSVRIFQ